MIRIGLLSSLSLLITATVALSADAGSCTLQKAVYASEAGGYTLRFKPFVSDAAAISHLFTLERDSQSLDGLVMTADEPPHSVARVMKGCPDGDVTGADIAACTGFEGYGFAISATGGVSNLAPATDPAPPTLLFAGLGPSLLVSPLGQTLKITVAPSDVFTFKECAP